MRLISVFLVLISVAVSAERYAVQNPIRYLASDSVMTRTIDVYEFSEAVTFDQKRYDDMMALPSFIGKTMLTQYYTVNLRSSVGRGGVIVIERYPGDPIGHKEEYVYAVGHRIYRHGYSQETVAATGRAYQFNPAGDTLWTRRDLAAPPGYVPLDLTAAALGARSAAVRAISDSLRDTAPLSVWAISEQ